jgi:hypothetical protein
MYKYIILCFTFIASVVYADSFKPYVESDVFLQSQPIDLNGAKNQWKQGNYTSGKYQYGNVLLESGIEKNNLKLGVFYKQEYQADFNRDTSDYYYGSQHNQLESNRNYQIDLQLNTYKAKGLRLQKTFKNNDKFQWSIGGSILKTSGLQSGFLTGTTLTNSSGKNQTYKAHVDYYYDQDQLLDRPHVNSPNGVGYALDTKVLWQPTARISASVQVQDLIGKVRWKNVPFTNANLSSEDGNKVIGDDGFIKIKPAVSGVEGYKTAYIQSLKPKINAALTFRNTHGQGIALKTKVVPNNTFVGIGAEIPKKSGKLSATFWSENIVQVEYVGKKNSLGVGLDNLNPKKANGMWLTFGWHP